jgi:hypothetical protein
VWIKFDTRIYLVNSREYLAFVFVPSDVRTKLGSREGRWLLNIISICVSCEIQKNGMGRECSTMDERSGAYIIPICVSREIQKNGMDRACSTMDERSGA